MSKIHPITSNPNNINPYNPTAEWLLGSLSNPPTAKATAKATATTLPYPSVPTPLPYPSVPTEATKKFIFRLWKHCLRDILLIDGKVKESISKCKNSETNRF